MTGASTSRIARSNRGVEAANIVFDTGGKAKLVEQAEQRQHGLSYGGSWHATSTNLNLWIAPRQPRKVRPRFRAEQSSLPPFGLA